MQGHLNILRDMYFPNVDKPGPLLRYSRKLFRSGGYWSPIDGNIVMAIRLVKEHGIDEAIDLIKHELIHWAIGETEETPHGDRFLDEAKRIDAPLVCLPFGLHLRRKSRLRYRYACLTCGSHSTRKRRGDLSCSRCGPGGYDEVFALVLTEKVIL